MNLPEEAREPCWICEKGRYRIFRVVKEHEIIVRCDVCHVKAYFFIDKTDRTSIAGNG